MVRAGGLEPPIPLGNQILSLARLPFRHARSEARGFCPGRAAHLKDDPSRDRAKGIAGGEADGTDFPTIQRAHPARCPGHPAGNPCGTTRGRTASPHEPSACGGVALTSLLNPTWWLSFAGQAFPWWLACALAGLAAWPLSLRVFRGLADRGAGLAIGLGLVGMHLAAWLMAYPYGGRVGLIVRAELIVLAAIALTYPHLLGGKPRHPVARFAPAAALALLGIIHIPHSGGGAAAGLVLCALLSAAVWWGDGPRLRRSLRASAAAFAIGQVLFLAGFLFFVNVRSYLPWATFDVSLYAAEKAGNLMHLNSMMVSRTMPPSDAWMLGERTNYYYGGHLMVAALAKLTGTPPRIAFNLGLATVFALTLSQGWSFVLNIVSPVRRALVVRLRGWRVPVPRGALWGLVGALAIACFGNLDSWQQLATRDPELARGEVEARLGAPGGKAALSRADLRWMPENLGRIDFWRSSRAIKGAPDEFSEPATITEFPYFSAILGDLHPHHMALPWTLLALSACLALMRRMEALRPQSELSWWRMAAPGLLAMGVFIGAVFPVNIWDSIVLAGVYAAVVAWLRRHRAAPPGWNHLVWPVVTGAILWLVALGANARVDTVVMFQGRAHFALALLIIAISPAVLRLFAPAAPAGVRFAVVCILGAFPLLLSGWDAAGRAAVLLGAPQPFWRDAVVFLVVAIFTRGLLEGGSPAWRWLAAAGTAYAVTGVAGLAVSQPFRLVFHSPLEAGPRALERLLPPMVASDVFGGEGIMAALWRGMPVKPLPEMLRTEFTDYLVHWGLFVVPVALFLAARFAAPRIPSHLAWENPPRPLLLAAGLAIILAGFNTLGSWTGPICVVLALACAHVAFRDARGEVSAPFLLAAAAFAWCAFCEVLHFDDNMGEYHERYNTVFKIYYPLWPMLAAAAVASLRLLLPVREGLPGLPRLPDLLRAGAGAGAFVALGALYFGAATADRTNGFFAWSRAALARSQEEFEGRYARGRDPEFSTARTLDAIRWLEQTPEYRGDLAAIEWIASNAPADAVVLEGLTGGAYSAAGRVASMTGRRAIIGWAQHENQWRGWGVPVPLDLALRYLPVTQRGAPSLRVMLEPYLGAEALDRPGEVALFRASLESKDALLGELHRRLPGVEDIALRDIAREITALRGEALRNDRFTAELVNDVNLLYRAPRFTPDLVERLRTYKVRYVFVGRLERAVYPPEGIAKFDVLPAAFDRDGVQVRELTPAALAALAGDGS